MAKSSKHGKVPSRLTKRLNEDDGMGVEFDLGLVPTVTSLGSAVLPAGPLVTVVEVVFHPPRPSPASSILERGPKAGWYRRNVSVSLYNDMLEFTRWSKLCAEAREVVSLGQSSWSSSRDCLVRAGY